jgi:hypothetical protein
LFIDTTLDLGLDANGKDPDLYSETLKKYHKQLWSKELPSGKLFKLSDSPTGKYLVFEDGQASIELGSDSIANSYAASSSAEIRKIVAEVGQELVDSFRKLNNTVGAFIIFPSTRFDGKMTINGARGFNSQIADRFDLTLECIRRHYLGDRSPLAEVLNRYSNFFSLFESFNGYSEFFLLKDLVDKTGRIKFFLPKSDPFVGSGYPRNSSEYLEYRSNSMEWVARRNARIAALNALND